MDSADLEYVEVLWYYYVYRLLQFPRGPKLLNGFKIRFLQAFIMNLILIARDFFIIFPPILAI